MAALSTLETPNMAVQRQHPLHGTPCFAWLPLSWTLVYPYPQMNTYPSAPLRVRKSNHLEIPGSKVTTQALMCTRFISGSQAHENHLCNHLETM